MDSTCVLRGSFLPPVFILTCFIFIPLFGRLKASAKQNSPNHEMVEARPLPEQPYEKPSELWSECLLEPTEEETSRGRSASWSDELPQIFFGYDYEGVDVSILWYGRRDFRVFTRLEMDRRIRLGIPCRKILIPATKGT